MAKKDKRPKPDKIEVLLTEEYRRARWKHLIRIFGMIVLALFPIALLGAEIQRHQAFPNADLRRILLMDLVLILVDLSMLVPIIFEVDTALVTNDKLVLKTILWKATLAWQDILSFKSAPPWRFAMLKTKRCFYLLNKRDIKRFEQLAETITSKAPPPQLKSPK